MSLKLPPYPEEYLEIIFSDENIQEQKSSAQTDQILPFAASGLLTGKLTGAIRLTHGEDVKEVFEVRINIQDSRFNFEPGDTIGIQPQNPEEEVDDLIRRLKYDYADKLFNLSLKEGKTKKKIPGHVPKNGTIRGVLLNNLDIRSIPKKAFLRAVSKYTTNPEEEGQLNELCAQNGSTKYTNFISTKYSSLLQLLKKFPSCFPPFTTLLEHLPRLNPRPYSIASSPLFTNPPAEIRFVFSLTSGGICTEWLRRKIDTFLIHSDSSFVSVDSQLEPSCPGAGAPEKSIEPPVSISADFCSDSPQILMDLDHSNTQSNFDTDSYLEPSSPDLVPWKPTEPPVSISAEFGSNPPQKLAVLDQLTISLYFRKPNKFRLPQNPEKPLIMVCAGTGMAPFLGFLEHRSLIKPEIKNLGPAWLFYGCRYSDRDFLYKNRLDEFLSSGVLSKVVMAFSRELNKEYIQVKIKGNAVDFVQMVDSGAVVYVCGGKNMVQDVLNVFVNCLETIKGCAKDEAMEFVKRLKSDDRYIEDVWI